MTSVEFQNRAAIVKDFMPRCLRGSGEVASALLLPLAGRYVVNRIVDVLTGFSVEQIVIVDTFRGGEAYVENVLRAAGNARVRVIDELSAHAHSIGAGIEGTPIVIDAGHFAIREETLVDVIRRQIERSLEQADEGSESTRLNRREDVLRACGESVSYPRREDLADLVPHRANHSAWVSPHAIVAPTARLTGHIVVNAGARVEPGATLIGPTIVGREATVGAGATVAGSVILDRALVQDRACVHQDVVVGVQRSPRRDVGPVTRMPSSMGCGSYTIVLGDRGRRTRAFSPWRTVTNMLKR